MQAQDISIAKAIDESPLNMGLRGADWLASPGNVAFVEGENIALFDDEGDGTYQVHFLNVEHGAAGVRSGKLAFAFMFQTHRASLIFGMVPLGMRHASIHARLVGGLFAGIRQTEFGPCELFVLSRDLWKGQIA